MKKFVDESWLVLAMGVVFALLLAGTQQVMRPQIDANEQAELMSSIVEVVPDMDPDSTPEAVEIEGVKASVYRCAAADGSLAGWAVEAEGTGFIDKISIVVGLTASGDEITGVKTVKHLETPGLGNKIDTKGEENFYPLQYAGKPTVEPMKLVKGEATGADEIQAITGATYSSQYVMDIVNRVIEQVVPRLPE